MKKLLIIALFFVNSSFGSKYNLDMSKKGCLRNVLSNEQFIMMFTYEELFEYCTCIGNNIANFLHLNPNKTPLLLMQDEKYLNKINTQCMKEIF